MAHAELHVEVAYCPGPGVTDLQALVLAPGATAADAVLASGVLARHGLDATALKLGVWGKPRPAETPLRDRDRVEIYRPLRVDPKEARRQRYQRHREKTARR
jgi:putative ubiquitin-RnfH superfamily antitoxin RatB of RatAB toxin-antitoxin module